jgi:hypothetical protein
MLRPFQLNGFLVSASALPSSVELHSRHAEVCPGSKSAREVTTCRRYHRKWCAVQLQQARVMARPVTDLGFELWSEACLASSILPSSCSCGMPESLWRSA